MACITSISFLVLINGAASPFFTYEKFICQRCPLSPLLFLLVVEGMRRAIGNAVRMGDLQGNKIIVGLRFTHLLFVDEFLIFCSVQGQDAEVLGEILSLYRSATGMQTNF